MNDYYALLGVSRQAGSEEIASAYRQLLLRERQEKGPEGEYGSLSQAYRTLINPQKRQEYDRFLDELAGKYVLKYPLSPTEAENCYLAGLTCMEQKNFQDAVDYFYRAVQLEPENSHFCSQLGLALGMFKERLAEAERYCKKAIQLDPDNPDFRFNLGFLYQRHNLTDAAQTAFDLANEALKVRQSRLLREFEPMITPWGEQKTDILDELSQLETLVEEVERGEAVEPREAEPPSPAKVEQYDLAADESYQLLRQLDELETEVGRAEIVEALSEPSVTSEPEMAPFLDEDLLKELDQLEAQVRGVEEHQALEVEPLNADEMVAPQLQAETAPPEATALTEEVREDSLPKTVEASVSTEPALQEPEIGSRALEAGDAEHRPEEIASSLETTATVSIAAEAEETWPAEAPTGPQALKIVAEEAVSEEPIRPAEPIEGPGAAEIAETSPLMASLSQVEEIERMLASSRTAPTAEPVPSVAAGETAVEAGPKPEDSARDVLGTAEVDLGAGGLDPESAAERLGMLAALEQELLAELENLRREKQRLEEMVS